MSSRQFADRTLAMVIVASLSWDPLTVHAIDQGGNWSVRGVGAGSGSCGEYVRGDPEQQRWFRSWLLGSISGKNSSAPGKYDVSNGTAPEGLAQWLQNYCQLHPLESFDVAVEAMFRELGTPK